MVIVREWVFPMGEVAQYTVVTRGRAPLWPTGGGSPVEIAQGQYTLHPTPYTLHPTPYTLHPTP